MSEDMGSLQPFRHAKESDVDRARSLRCSRKAPAGRAGSDEEVSQSQCLGRCVFEAAMVLYAVVILGVIVQGYLLGILLRWW